MSLEDFLNINVYTFMMIVARFGTAVMLMPGFGDIYVSPRIRLSLVLAIAVILTPVLAGVLPPQPASPAGLVKLIAGEVFVGAFLGGLIRIMTSTLNTAGTIIAYHAGAANALVFDPIVVQQSSVYATFMTTVGMVLIFVTDMHHLMLQAIYDSYAVMVPGQLFDIGDFSETVAVKVSESFTLAMRLAAPTIVAGVTFYVGLGLMARLMPQMQVFFIGIPIQMLLGLSVFALSLPIMMYTFLAYFEENLISLLQR